MNKKKISIIISVTDDRLAAPLLNSLEGLTRPERFSVELKPIAWGGASIKVITTQ